MAARHGGARHGRLQHQGRPLTELVADCARCAALCCAALPYARSREFPEDKPAAVPCRHLEEDFRCGIHAGLLEGGWRGCVVFDCFGAGQQVVQVTYGGRTWRDDPATADEMFAVFEVVRALHEVRFLLQDPAVAGSPYAQEGEALFAKYCALCHGKDARGYVADNAPTPPAQEDA